ncbi:hypothetical protein E1A91_A01G145400v1 [Gossypium mustelinum]|uniref:K Homology domain-containing protein n=2 Tax=Gossypium mustelinum TaxID=34275 RepID=A0A5D3AFE1_GOSMU|nr:hypothetical protein E1A91_A01G145400v1 [Gossypium mustelinum]
MRRATGANIRVSSKEQLSKSAGLKNDEVVQVIGSLQSVQDALFHITGRLRESILPMKPPFPGINPPPYLALYPEMPPPLFRPRHNHAPPCPYPSPSGPFNGIDPFVGPPQQLDHQPPFLHGMDHMGPHNVGRGPYSYGGDRHGHGPMFDGPSSLGSWTPQAGTPRNCYLITLLQEWLLMPSLRFGAGQSRSSAGIKLISNCSMLVVEVSYSEHHVVYSAEVSKILLFRRKCIVVIRLGFQR